MQTLLASLRIAGVSLLICAGVYTAVILGVAQVCTPVTANGSLITRGDGTIVGSRLIAQKFEKPGYFWPRPSAPDYNASGAAGSNKSPTSSDLTDRAAKTVEQYGATPDKALPADLAAASGGGLDPHITEHAALYQAVRVAGARGVAPSKVESLIRNHAFSPGGPLTPDRLVNVLELNLALDAETGP
ncbi:MAG: potassium-transporting ATPase subunit C [Phycisphaerales bacterium]|nr:potassium-transporting ATPase subunit C [Phycisphaerales bacterium]